MFEKFTDRARLIIVLTQEEAQRLRSEQIGVDQLFLGLLAERRCHSSMGLGLAVLDALGVDLDEARTLVEDSIGEGRGASEEYIPFTQRAKDVLALALQESVQFGHDHIGTEHLLLGVVRDGTGAAAQLLDQLGLDLATLRREVLHHEDTVGSVASRAVTRARVLALGAARAPEDVDLLSALTTEIKDGEEKPPAVIEMVSHLQGRIPGAVRRLGIRPMREVLSAMGVDEPDEWQLLAALTTRPSSACEAVLGVAGLTGAGVAADAWTHRDELRERRWSTSRSATVVTVLSGVLTIAVVAAVIVHALGPGEPWQLLAVLFVWKGEPTSRPLVPVVMVPVLILLGNPLAAGLQAACCLVNHRWGA